MSPSPTNLPTWWNETLDAESLDVRVESLNVKLVQFVVRAAQVHAVMFGTPLVITSGNDGKHVPGSAHGKNAAVDLRSHDIDAGSQMVFAMVLISLGNRSGVAVYDERAARSPHWHCEDADMVGA
jgi:hypothetical protein